MKGAHAQIVPVYAYDQRFPNVLYVRDNDNEKRKDSVHATPDSGRPSEVYQFARFQGMQLLLAYGNVCFTNKPLTQIYRTLRIPGQAHGRESRPRHLQRQINTAEQSAQPVERDLLERSGPDMARGGGTEVVAVRCSVVCYCRYHAIGTAARPLGAEFVEVNSVPWKVG